MAASIFDRCELMLAKLLVSGVLVLAAFLSPALAAEPLFGTGLPTNADGAAAPAQVDPQAPGTGGLTVDPIKPLPAPAIDSPNDSPAGPQPEGAKPVTGTNQLAADSAGKTLTEPTAPQKSLRSPSAGSAKSTGSDDLRLGPAVAGETALALRIVLGLTALAILPALLVCLTSFLRIVIVLSMLRHAIGMPETPPNTVVIGLALFLTIFTMSPVLQVVNEKSLQPFMSGATGIQTAYTDASKPLREFMFKQTRERDLVLMVELSKAPVPKSPEDVSNVQLIPAFMLSELRAAFQIGFVIFLPFLLIDLIVSSILMALGMMMMPPVSIALPLKLLMFVLVDGWTLVLRALVGSFH